MSMILNHKKGELEKRYKNFNPNAKFTIVSQWVAQDGNLSPRALGIYLYLASNNHTFKFSENGLYHHFKTAGLWTIKKSIKELEDNHLIKRTRPTKDKHGKWTHGSKWNLYYLPNKIVDKLSKSHDNSNSPTRRKPSVRIPSVRIPSVRKPSTNKYQVKQVSKEISTKSDKYLSRDSDDDRTGRLGEYENSILGKFDDLFHEQPVDKFKRYVHKALENSSDYGVTRDRLFTAMRTARKHCDSRNPYKIASYIVQCVKYPQQRKGTANKYYLNVLNMLNRNFQRVNVNDPKLRSAVKELLKSHSYSAICTAIGNVNTYEVYNDRAEAHPVRYIKKSLNGEDWIHE